MNKKLLGVLGVAALLLAGNFAWQEVKEVDAEDTVADEVQALFTKYYNEGVYTKDTVINLKDSAKEELKTHFHASVNKLERTTYYNGDALWMENEAGTYSYYGTSGSDMTSGRVETLDDTSNTVVVKGQTMEQYYATLHDFSVGTHSSVHSNNEELDLATGWEKEGTVYFSTSEDILDAFRLFTAPLWIGTTESNANYIPFTKATVEESNNKLIMKLYVDETDAEGKLIADSNNVFSQATISYKTTFVVTNSADWILNDNALVYAWIWGSEIYEDKWVKCYYQNESYNLCFDAYADYTGAKIGRFNPEFINEDTLSWSDKSVIWNRTDDISFENHISEEVNWVSDDKWTLVGIINGKDCWNEDIRMINNGDLWYVTLDMQATDSFKVRKNGAWDVAFPSSNWNIWEGAGKYTITFNEETKSIDVVKNS